MTHGRDISEYLSHSLKEHFVHGRLWAYTTDGVAQFSNDKLLKINNKNKINNYSVDQQVQVLWIRNSSAYRESMTSQALGGL